MTKNGYYCITTFYILGLLADGSDMTASTGKFFLNFKIQKFKNLNWMSWNMGSLIIRSPLIKPMLTNKLIFRQKHFMMIVEYVKNCFNIKCKAAKNNFARNDWSQKTG